MVDLFSFFIKQRGKIIRLFWVGYGFLFLLFIAGGYSILTNNQFAVSFYFLGKKLGQTALATFCLLLLPGILKRFQIRLKWVSVIMWFRRQLGILVFLLGCMHFSFLRVFPMIANSQSPFSNLATFEIFGLLSLTLFFPLFLTSNDASMRYMKKYWYTLHKLVYFICWFVFSHVILQQISIWGVIIGITAFFEATSHAYSRFKS